MITMVYRNTIGCQGVVILICFAVGYAASNGLASRNNLAEMQFQNHFDRALFVQCHGAKGMYRVQSVHNNRREDRVWNWECRQVAHRGYPRCWHTGFVNDFDQPMFFMCNKDQYIAGVESHHSNHHEDRRWKFLCCSVPHHKTSSCRITGFVNEFDGHMNFWAGHGEVITGVFSYHDNHRE